MTIKNIVFDVGNVLVQWNPLLITARSFPERTDHVELAQRIFKSAVWTNLNLGKISESEAIEQYLNIFKFNKKQLQVLMQTVKETQLPITGSIELLKNLHAAKFSLYALTDNVKEIVSYLQQKYDFWPLLKGIVVSAEVGFLKPSPSIYQYLLNTYQLKPAETVFIDDHLPNIEGARKMGMYGIHFIDTALCLQELEKIGVITP